VTSGIAWGRIVLVWGVLAVAMVVLRVAREGLLTPTVGALRAHQLGSVMAALIVVGGNALALEFLRAVGDVPLQLRIGGVWVGLTIAFELVFGHYVVGHPWERLLHDYDLSAGRLWSLVLLATFLGPYIAGRFVGPRPPP